MESELLERLSRTWIFKYNKHPSCEEIRCLPGRAGQDWAVRVPVTVSCSLKQLPRSLQGTTGRASFSRCTVKRFTELPEIPKELSQRRFTIALKIGQCHSPPSWGTMVFQNAFSWSPRHLKMIHLPASREGWRGNQRRKRKGMKKRTETCYVTDCGDTH